MRKRGVIAAVVVVVLVAIVAVVWWVVIPSTMASRIQQAADERGLAIQYGAAHYRFSSAEVENAVATPKGSKAMVVTMPSIVAALSGTHPTAITIARADVDVAGSVESVLRVLDGIRKADDALPEGHRVPFDVQAGKVRWKEPFGDDTSIAFSSLVASTRPAERLVKLALAGGKLDLQDLSVSPLKVSLTKKGDAIDGDAELAPEDGGRAHLTAHRTSEGDDADLEIEALRLATVTPKITGLDLAKAKAAGKAHAERSTDGEVKSNGNLTFDGLRLPPAKVGPVSIVIGGTVHVVWKGSPKKGAPGTMKLDDARVDVTLGGKTRTIKVTGDVSVGEKGEGPFVVHLDWDLGPIPCSEIAGDLAGALTGGFGSGLVAGAVSGNVAVHGTIRGDLGEGAKRTMDVKQACKLDVDLGKTLGGLLPP